MVYTLRLFFSSKCSLFHNSNVFGTCIIHILYTGCGKIKKKIIPAPRRLMQYYASSVCDLFYNIVRLSDRTALTAGCLVSDLENVKKLCHGLNELLPGRV